MRLADKKSQGVNSFGFELLFILNFGKEADFFNYLRVGEETDDALVLGSRDLWLQSRHLESLVRGGKWVKHASDDEKNWPFSDKLICMLQVPADQVGEEEWLGMLDHVGATLKHSVSDDFFGVAKFLDQRRKHSLKVLLDVGKIVLEKKCDDFDGWEGDLKVDVWDKFEDEDQELSCVVLW